MKLFNVGVKAIFEQDGKILILKGAGDNSFWKIPGGRIDGDESIEDTLRRELEEELPGIKNVEVGDLVFAKRVHNDITDDGVSLVFLFYHVEADLPDPIELDDEHGEYLWAEPKQAVEMLISNLAAGVEVYCKNKNLL